MRQPASPHHVLLPVLTLALVAGCGGPTDEPASSETDAGEEMSMDPAELERRAREIHENVLTIDTHDDIPFNFATPEVDPLNADRQVNLEKMRAGGLGVGFFVVYVGQTERTPENYEAAKQGAMTKFEAIHRMTDEMYPDLIGLAHTADDAERIHAEGRLVAAIGIENGYAIGTDLSLLETYHELGARYITLAHNGNNDIADSAQPNPSFGDTSEENGGISEFGEQVIAEMNRLGILVDVSHISKAASLEAMQLSASPVIASHSGAHAVNAHARNMDDEQLMALRENGGVMQAVALGGFVKSPSEERQAEVTALRESIGFTSFSQMTDEQREAFSAGMAEIRSRYPDANVADFVDHIDHAVNLIGIDHVGISSDFDGGGGIDGWRDASETLNVTLELVRRGYSEEEIRRLWGGNTLRIWRAAEEVAAELQQAGG
ncbi:dipeptidase [Candidatus Palauibacter sp.]|uniref:dipeptidase n=1 Tax=Candidatus Palauibacter sp. TaxID=3101350 RepID=UPI003C6F3580